MKNLKSLILGSVLLAAVAATAQNGVNFFEIPRFAVVESPRLLDATAATFNSNPLDTHGYEGTAAVVINSFTNSGGALTVTPQGSTDNTTWANLANYALAKSASIIYTNTYYATNGLTATNTFLLPGAVVTPTASTSGFATPYLDASTPFTNSGALTITTKGTYVIGYVVQDAPRYFRLVWTPTGSSSNDVVSATFIGRKQQFP